MFERVKKKKIYEMEPRRVEIPAGILRTRKMIFVPNKEPVVWGAKGGSEHGEYVGHADVILRKGAIISQVLDTCFFFDDYMGIPIRKPHIMHVRFSVSPIEKETLRRFIRHLEITKDNR